MASDYLVRLPHKSFCFRDTPSQLDLAGLYFGRVAVAQLLPLLALLWCGHAAGTRRWVDRLCHIKRCPLPRQFRPIHLWPERDFLRSSRQTTDKGGKRTARLCAGFYVMSSLGLTGCSTMSATAFVVPIGSRPFRLRPCLAAVANVRNGSNAAWLPEAERTFTVAWKRRQALFEKARRRSRQRLADFGEPTRNRTLVQAARNGSPLGALRPPVKLTIPPGPFIYQQGWPEQFRRGTRSGGGRMPHSHAVR